MSANSGVIPVSVRSSPYDRSLIGLEVKAKADCSISGRHSCWEGGALSPSSGCAPGARAGRRGGWCVSKKSVSGEHGFRTMTISGESSRELNKRGRMACFVEKLTFPQMLGVRYITGL